MPTEDGGQYLITRLEAQRRSTLVQIGAIAAAVVCIALAAFLQKPINRQRKDLQLVLQSDLYSELPPEFAWVSAAGGTFRGLAADILWMRAENLKMEGKYFESHQLAKWICTLTPRFATVWSFQAWNMAYNISVGTHTAPERWQWVYNAIRLLRDEGIPNNERVVGLYHQLAWIWLHKVGDRMDDFHWYYKRMWAATMETLLGPPPVGLSNAESIDWFRPVAQAPRKLQEVIAAHPGVKKLVEALDDLGIDVEVGTDNQRIYHPLEETFFREYTRYVNENRLSPLRTKPPQQSENRKKLFEFFDSANKADFNALLAYMRAKVLREQYKMDPQYMLAMTAKFGTDEPVPIDWRTPWAMSIYWAMYGTEKGRQAKNVEEFDLMNTDRILLFSLATLAKEGRYVFRINLDDPLHSFLNMLPDTRYIEAMHKKYIELGKVHAEEGEVVENTTSELLRAGHVNNLESAVVALYLSGKHQEAQKYLQYLAKNYKDLYTKEYQEKYIQDLGTYVESRFAEMAGSRKDAVLLIYPILESGYLSLAYGLVEEYRSAVQAAGLIYKTYEKEMGGERLGLPPFAQIRAQALAGFVSNEEYPLLVRSMVWGQEQNEIKQRCYDFVADYLVELCKRENVEVERAFPAPAGLEQWRKEHPISAQPGDQEKQKENSTQE